MAKYVGLTDDHARRQQEHGNPSDWKAWGPFASEFQARNWEKGHLGTGHQGGPGGAGWEYGYMYTITPQTTE